MIDLVDIAEGKTSPKNRGALSRAPKVERVDPAILWRSLPPGAAEEAGSLAIAISLSAAGTHARDGIDHIYNLYDATLRESCQRLDDLLALHLPRAFISGNGRIFPKLPVLPGLKAAA